MAADRRSVLFALALGMALAGSALAQPSSPASGVYDDQRATAAISSTYALKWLVATSPSLGGALLSSNTCTAQATISVPGATTNAVVAASGTGAPNATVKAVFVITSPGVVTPYLCDVGTLNVTPTAMTYNLRISVP